MMKRGCSSVRVCVCSVMELQCVYYVCNLFCKCNICNNLLYWIFCWVFNKWINEKSIKHKILCKCISEINISLFLDEKEAFSIVLANRSAALYHMGEYKLALVDIDLAIDYGYPVNLTYKVLERYSYIYINCFHCWTIFIELVYIMTCEINVHVCSYV